jgi:hypothetical protein
MGLLFLDPLVLGLIGVTLVGCWLVWRGSLRSWFAASGAWTMLVWPLPAVLVGLPFVVGPVRAALSLILDATGLALTQTADAFVFTGLYLVPLVGLTVWPPRWLLPGWARARLATPAGGGSDARPGGVDQAVIPACLGRRGHGSRARWVWRVDAVTGILVVADGQLHFRPDPPVGTMVATDDLPAADGTPRPVEPAASPREEPDHERSGTRTGATWGRRYLDADLAAVDDVRLQARRPWARDGLLTLASTGRPPAHVWVADVKPLQVALDRSRA